MKDANITFTALKKQYDELRPLLDAALSKKDYVSYSKLLEQEAQIIQASEALTASSARNHSKASGGTSVQDKKPSSAKVTNAIVKLFVKQFVGARTFTEIYSTYEHNEVNRDILKAIWKKAQNGDVTWHCELYSLTTLDRAVMKHYGRNDLYQDDNSSFTTEYQECLNIIHGIEHAKNNIYTPADLRMRGADFRRLLMQNTQECKLELIKFMKRINLNISYKKATTTDIKHSSGLQLSLI